MVTLEKTSCSREELAAEGCDDETIRAVELMSRQEGEAENDFLERIKTDSIALRIKILDVRDQLYMLGIQEDRPETREGSGTTGTCWTICRERRKRSDRRCRNICA